MLTLAIEKQLPVETIERLLAMRRELKAEAAREAYFAALSRFQASYPKIEKRKAVYNKDGKSVRYWYAPLDDIIDTVRETLQSCGFSYTIKPVQESDSYVTSTVIATHEAGHSEESSFTIPIDPEAYMNAPQKVASARTFGLRYAFCNVFGIVTGDQDDDTAQTYGLDDLLSIRDEMKYLDEAEDMESLREHMRLIWEQLAEDSPKRPIVKRYYDQRKAKIAEEAENA
jgi:hypothetical protein